MTNETITPAITNVPNESFYLERFKNCLAKSGYVNGRVVDTKFHCEIYKGFALVIWEQEWQRPNNQTEVKFSNYVWEVGGLFDHLTNLAWISQGAVHTGYNAVSLEQAVKKSKKKIDLLSEMYQHKNELSALSQSYPTRIANNSSSLYNAKIGDVVAIRAFGRTRLGKIVKLVGNRFVIAYMTPSNTHDVHYKTLPLSEIYPKD